MRIIFSNLLRYLIIVFFCFYSSSTLAQLTLSRPDVPGYEKQISGSGLSNKGLITAAGYYDGSIYLWETATGKLLRVIENCYKPDNYYGQLSIYINDTDSLVAWGYEDVGKTDEKPVAYFFAWTKFSSSIISSIHKIELPDAVFSIDYSSALKKWLIGTGILGSTDNYYKPGIYLVDAVQKTLIKEWHVTNRFSMEAKFAPDASYFLTVPKPYYSQDTLYTVYKFSGAGFSIKESFENFKGSDPLICPLPKDGFVLAFNFPSQLWVVNKKERKLVTLKADFNLIRNIFYDGEYKSITLFTWKNEARDFNGDIKDFEWLQFDEDWQISGRKTISMDPKPLSVQINQRKLVMLASRDSLLHLVSSQLPIPLAKLSLQLQTGHSQSIDEVITHPLLPIAASNSRGEGKIKLWDLQTGFQLADIKTGYAEDLQFIPANNQLAWREMDKIVLYDLKSRAVIQEIKPDILGDGNFSFAVLPDGKRAVVYTDYFELVIDMASGNIIKEQRKKRELRVTSFRFLDKIGNRIIYSYNSEGDTISCIGADGIRKGFIGTPEIKKWWLKNDNKEIALLLTKGGRLHNEKIVILTLPSMKLINEIPLSVSSSVSIDPSFLKLVAGSNDTLYINDLKNKANNKFYMYPDEYLSSDEFTWDAGAQYVIRTVYPSGLQLFRNVWSKMGEEIQTPMMLYADSSRKQLIVGSENGLWSLPLNYLSKGRLVDSSNFYYSQSDAKNSFLFAGSDEILYSAMPASKTANLPLAFSFSNNEVKPITNLAMDEQVYNPSLRWLAGTKNGYVHFFHLDAKKEIVSHDSLPGLRPILTNKNSLLGLVSRDSTSIEIYSLPGKSKIYTLPLKNADFVLRGAGMQFSAADDILFYAAYSGGAMYFLKGDSIIKKEYHTTHEITSCTAAPGNKGIYVGDITGTIQLIDFTTGKSSKTFYGHTEAITSLSVADSLLYSASKDGTVRIWNRNDGSLLLTMVLDKQGHVLMIDEETNNYASSRRDPRSIAFVYKGKLVSFDQFDLFSNRPNLVLAKTGMADKKYIASLNEAVQKRIIRAGITQGDAWKSLPSIRLPQMAQYPLVTKKRKMEVAVTAQDSLSFITTIHLLVNGVPLFGEKGLQLTTPSKTYTATLTVPLSVGKNRVEVTAQNSKHLFSAKEVFQIEYEATENQPSKIYFVGVGISSYADTVHNLRYAAKDIRDIVKAIKKQYPDAIIDTLLDEMATRQNLLKLKQRLQESGYDDRIICSFSGHGLLDDKKDFYFGTYNVDFNNPQKEGWSFADMQWLLDSIPARQKLLLIDACHSGEVDKDEPIVVKQNSTAVRSVATARSSIKKDAIGLQNSFALMQELFSGLQQSNGTAMITAAGGRQYALEGAQWNNGVFTYSLLNGLTEKKADANNDGIITVSELRNFLFKEVVRLTGGSQQPTSRVENLVNDWEVW
jgi:WD40 repeat protein